MPELLQLWTYPIKSCAGVALDTSALDPAGLAHDRTFMVVDADGTMRTQRSNPLLATIHPRVSDDGGELELRAPGVDGIRVPVDRDGAREPVTLFGNPYTGIDQGDGVAEWISGVLGAPSRLVRVPPEHRRVTDGVNPGSAGYADSGAVHVLSTASLRGLNERVDGAAVPMSRFRPNLVVDGWDEPHREDDGRELAIGDVRLGFAKLAVRCATTLVDQETGRRSGPEPLRTLARYRRGDGGGVVFGAKFSVLQPGTLAVGDQVVVPSR